MNSYTNCVMEMSWFYCINLLVFLSVFFLILSKLFHVGKKQHQPPSPPSSLPFIGHLHLLNKEPLHRSLYNLCSKYGPIISLKFGWKSAVIISSPSAFEECFTKNDVILANRPPFLVGKLLNYNHTTVVAAPYGPHWRNLRRVMTLEIFSTARLNDFLGVRQEEVKMLLKKLHRISSTAQRRWTKVEMKSRLSKLSFNIIMMMASGKRYYDEEQEQEVEELEKNANKKSFREMIGEIFELCAASNPGDFLPFLQWIDYQNLEKKMRILQKETDEFLQGLIDEVRNGNTNSSHTSSTELRKTTIEAMLSLQQKDPQYYTDQIIKGIILILFTGGTDTSSVTIEWAMALLLNHPEVLKKARSEIDKFVGNDRLINESDICEIPYIQAIVNETLRLFPPVPVITPHESSSDCTIGEYNIRSKTMLLVNAWAIHRDPELWEDPTSFKPERFEGVESDTYRLKLIPFGMGRRGCPGAGLGNRVVALVLASLIQCFDWERCGEELVDMSEGTGLTLPKLIPLEAMFKAREEMTEVLRDL